MKRILKMAGITILLLFVLLQFYPRGGANKSADTLKDITRVHNVPPGVQKILTAACYDCHSNNTTYPWYANIQPVAMWLKDHIDEGKKELNFSEYAGYNLARRFRKLEEIGKEVKEGEMPLKSYTLVHREAALTTKERSMLANWSETLRDSMRNVYPADSLVRKKN
ncbi:MAG: cytochrome C [Chitinophagaceae bacterium]|nr:MAG: cytochrome C [Chitinophagaceae bacterium]